MHRSIAALGHDWKYVEAVSNWNEYACETATVPCGNDPTNKLTVNVE